MAIPRQEGHTSVMNTKRATALILAIAIFGDAATIYAQSASPVSSPIVGGSLSAATDANTVHLLAGRSTIVDVGMPIARVSLTSPDVADAMVTTPNQLLVNGKIPGTISMFVWDRGGAVRRFEVSVGRDLSPLNEQLRQLFPGERLEVQSTGKNIVVSGLVSSKELADKVSAVVAGYVEKKDDVVSLMQVREAQQASQVLLRVRFAEVSRSAMTDLGASLYGDGAKNLIGRSTTGQFGQPALPRRSQRCRTQRLGAELLHSRPLFLRQCLLASHGQGEPHRKYSINTSSSSTPSTTTCRVKRPHSLKPSP